MRMCEMCGREFKTTLFWAKYCSAGCVKSARFVELGSKHGRVVADVFGSEAAYSFRKSHCKWGVRVVGCKVQAYSGHKQGVSIESFRHTQAKERASEWKVK